MSDSNISTTERNEKRRAEKPAAYPTVLRLTGRQHAQLFAHLFPGDGREAVALALCGRGEGPSPTLPQEMGSNRQILAIYSITPIAYELCSVRTPDRVTWSTEPLMPLLAEAAKRGMAVLKIHSHPGDYRQFSWVDDEADRDLFPGVAAWVSGDRLHASAVMLPDGRIFARTVSSEGEFTSIEAVSVAGDDFLIWYADEFSDPAAAVELREQDPGEATDPKMPQLTLRTEQAFGAGTVRRLRRLSVAVIGASGTGSPTIEMFARLGVGELILVDGDRVEDKNRGRILNTFPEHATKKELKVQALARAVRDMGFGTHVVPIPRSLWHPDVVRRVAQADVIFGCMDSIDGRDILNRLATYYSIPYFDVGVRLDADGMGGVEQICGTVHYLQPDGSSLASRKVYTPDDVRAAVLRRTDPAAYAEQVHAKYIRGVNEDRPAVISVNMLFAALAVNELLARIHGYRDDGNTDFASFGMSLTQARLIHESDGTPCPALAKKAGRGDVRPLLDTPELGITQSRDDIAIAWKP